MANTIKSPYMNLQLPIPGIETGPQYAIDNNAAFTLIDSHTHIDGQGQPIPTAGLNINADLTLNGYNLIAARSIRIVNQAAPLTLPTDRNCVTVVNGELFYVDASGNQVQITLGGSVDTSSSGNIVGMGATTAAVLYTSINKTFSFYSDTNTPANMLVGPLSIGTNTLNPSTVTLTTSGTITSPYTITFADALPSSQALMTIDNTGKIANIVTDNTTTSVVAGKLVANIPPGMIMPYAGAALVSGWLICDGSAVSRTVYANLFTAIGIAWGSGDGSTTFNVPDFRGLFMRGVDGSAGRDPDSASRTAIHPGGNTGNNVGSYEADLFKTHNHAINNARQNTNGGNNDPWDNYPARASTNNSGFGSAGTTQDVGGNETRPVNVYINYFVKI